MSDHTVILSVAAYASEAAARHAFEAVGRAGEHGDHPYLAAAVLHKGPDGALTIESGEVEPASAWGGALLSAALTVLVAPIGIALLPPVVTTPADWTRVAALVTHFWQQVPQATLRLMSDTLESNPAGILIVAIDTTATDIEALLSEASTMTVVDSSTLGRDSAFGRTNDEPTND